MEVCALDTGQSTSNVTASGAQTKPGVVECVSGMEQRSNDAAALDAQTKLSKEVCA